MGPRHLLRGARLYAPNLRVQFTENTVVEGKPVELERLLSRDRGFEPRARSVTRPRKALGTRLTRGRLALGQTHTRTPRRWSHTGFRPRLPAVRALPPRRQGPVHAVRARRVARAHQPARVVIQRNRVLNNGGVVVRGVRACESNPPRLHILDPGSHSCPACVATQHTANVLVEANVMLNSSVQRVHVNRTHASNVLVAEG